MWQCDRIWQAKCCEQFWLLAVPPDGLVFELRISVMNLSEFAYEGERVLLNLKQTSVSLSVADREVYAFDLEGKPLSFWMNGQTFVWTLDGRVIKKWRDAESPKSRFSKPIQKSAKPYLHKAAVTGTTG